MRCVECFNDGVFGEKARQEGGACEGEAANSQAGRCEGGEVM